VGWRKPEERHSTLRMWTLGNDTSNRDYSDYITVGQLVAVSTVTNRGLGMATEEQRIERMKSHSTNQTITPDRFPALLTPDDVAALLRTSRKAIYALVERGQLPCVVRIGRRVLLREAELVEWLRQKSHAIAER
jgi:excisionase family DNA binding protein